MAYVIKFFFSCTFLCGIFLSSEGKEGVADSLYVSGKYFEASIEYERLIFNAQDQSNLYYFKYRKALCYKRLKEFGKALEELQPIYFANSADSLFLRVYYEQTLCYYLNGEPAKALWKIDEYCHRSADSASYRYFMPVKIICLNETYQWNEARNCFMSYIALQNFTSEKETEMKLIVENLYSKRRIPHIRSIDKAENWSRFIPGSGQIYAGKTGEGVVNFLINASLLAFSAQQVLNGFYITGYFAGLGFLNKTYQGGIKRSGVLASKSNKEQLVRYNTEINELIRANFNFD